MLKRIFCIIAAFAVCLSLVVVPASADSETSFYLLGTSFPGTAYGYGSRYMFGVYVTSSTAPVGLAVMSSGSSYHGLFISSEPFTFQLVQFNSGSSPADWTMPSNSDLVSLVTVSTYSDIYGAYVYNHGYSLSTYNPLVPLYTSSQSVKDAFASWTPPSPSEPIPFSVTVPSGYVLYYKSTVSQDVTVRLNYGSGFNVATFGNFSQNYFTQRFGVAGSALPSPGASYSWQNGNSFEFELVNAGIFGFGSEFVASSTIASVSDFYQYIYNPFLSLIPAPDGIRNGFISNPDIKVMFSDSSALHDCFLLPLGVAGNVTSENGGIIAVTSNVSQDLPILDVEITVDSGQSSYVTNNEDGEYTLPVSGGDDAGSTAADATFSAIGGYEDVVQEFADMMETLFSSVMKAFKTLISGVKAFTDSIRIMLNWLPEEIQNVYYAAIIVVVLGGVIKVVFIGG